LAGGLRRELVRRAAGLRVVFAPVPADLARLEVALGLVEVEREAVDFAALARAGALRAGDLRAAGLRAVVLRPDEPVVAFFRAPAARFAPPVLADDSAPIGVGAAGAGCAGWAAGHTEPGCC